jgi:endonuclease/exonuclease/phosphatase family metal-dependent hydrolase
MRDIHAQNNLPWVILGDFNEILYSHQKEGGNPRSQHYMQAFRDAINGYNLEDIGFSGDPFTWRRGRIRERLDRVLASSAWTTMHLDAALMHLESMHSDHSPILLDTEPPVPIGNPNKVKRIEANWLQEESF